MPQKTASRLETPEEELARLRRENAEFQEALKMAEWSNHAKDVMIDLAEKTFNIPIRKNLVPNSKGACHREGQGPDHGPSLSAVWQELAGLLPAQGHIGETAPDRRDGRGVCTRNTHLRQGYRRCEAARDLCPPFWESLRTHGRPRQMMDIIARNNLQVRMPRKKPRTTDSAHGLPTYPNLVKEIIPTRKNQVWVTDITYVPIWLNDNEYIFCYVSIITDAYTKEIISWYVGESLEAWCSVECLIKAFDTLAEEDKTGLIHHSDRGVQYVSAAYTSLLLDAGIKISMTESGDPKDNAIAERINNTLKMNCSEISNSIL